MSCKGPALAGHILDEYCIRLSSAAPFCKNYAKLYFDAKHLEKQLNTAFVRFVDIPLKYNLSFSGKFNKKLVIT